ncbi:serine O-acetyltransferase [Campylobacter geochelonis]|uniref:Serine acetyltransferase n=1 Tax=Campylobacter geochelonis TaxID=1780362 RepID=A0A128EHV1_9BACT|nr:serine O-acetyltransferase [Campylobacter geochelonis]QKF71307.1 serine O-acetyltransferase [Campylobacter geochelonis]CZE48181.1 serine O-acetyltransferase [Campylobacter geochelonis]
MGFWQIIKEDFCEPRRQDPAFNSWVEIIFNYPGVWAIINYRFAHFFYENGFKTIGRMIAGISRFLTGVDLHPAAKVGRQVFLDHASGIVIGETTIIGDRVLLYQGVTLGGVSLNRGKRHPTLEDGVVIGAGAKVLGNITIGKNSKVGANSVVVKDVPCSCTAVGIPARIVGQCEENQLAHDKIPDINKELFSYLIKRLSILEEAVKENKTDIIKEDIELEEKYSSYLKSLKN